jgi:hypothetical protein
MAKGDVEVHPQDGSWAVKVEGEGVPRSTHENKTDAIGSGKALAKSLGAELIVKNSDGRIADKASYGNDPRNVPG